ncbi:hypothetical protein JB92DRAFT_2951740 [Gautieria morchelliformis]|nr:hypothetical protein JB92DRAFT_2951740 [Gautieria morchelliformis]
MEIRYKNGRKGTVHRRQLSLTAAYTFTDYKAQGQTLQPVVVDIGNPPSGWLNAFNAYVAISLLRNFNSNIFTTHPNIDLAKCDECLEILNKETEIRYNAGKW